MKPKALIVRTAGVNCDRETEFAFQKAGANSEIRHINYIKQLSGLSGYQIICIPGGFSYGDDLGAGKIMSLEFICWLKDSIKKFINKGGLILGICNGFQVLAKTGILPDIDFRQKITLTNNDSGRFEDRWVYLRLPDKSRNCPAREIWLEGLPDLISLPVAHGEGKFYAERDILDKIEANNQVVLRYVDKNSKVSGYPYNPNGSLSAVAGITDITGRILGLMPHPERCVFKHHLPYWRQEEFFPWGLNFFKNAVAYFK